MAKRKIEEENGWSACGSNTSSYSDLGSSSYRSLGQGSFKRRLWRGDDQLVRQQRHFTDNFGSISVLRSHQDGETHDIGDIKHNIPKTMLDRNADRIQCDQKQFELGDGGLANGHQETSSSKHLVKTVSDLPKFVMVEDFNIASYTIDDEPYLCLPNLLQFIQQKYPLDKVIDVFEMIVTNFKPATPKQVEGFIKAIALPLGAKDCPLIRKADAERVCRVLSERFSNNQIQATANEHDKIIKENTRENDCSKSLTPFDTQSKANTAISNTEVLGYGGERRDTKSEGGQISPKGGNGDLDRRSEPPIRSKKYEISSTNGQPHLSHRTLKGTSSKSEINPLFGSDDNCAILNLARAATSTLRIKVYHRCFGKCGGLYYPSKLKDSESECIECATCFLLLSPKKFILHTHGSREENVIHWGFSLRQWRYYISLYKNQDMNKLDEDELLVQLNKLKAEPDIDQFWSDEDNSAEEAKLSSLSSSSSVANNNCHNITHDNLSHIRPFQNHMKSIPVPTSSIHSTSGNITPRTIHDRRPSAIQSNYPIGVVKPTMLNSADNNASIGSVLENLAGQQSRIGAQQWTIGQQPKSRVIGQNPLDASSCLNPSQYSLNNLLANPSFFSQHFDLSNQTSSRSNLFSMPRLDAPGPDKGANIYDHLVDCMPPPFPMNMNMNYHASMADRFIKQDIFLTSSLATYLSSKRLDGDLVRDIIGRTLDAVRKSRLMF